jgi:electron transfer flavoprotein alpha subunit
MTVLCLVERDGAGAADASLRAVTFARGLAGGTGEGIAAVAFGAVAEPLAAAASAVGVADVYAVTADGLAGYAPQAWARALAGLIGETAATAVVAAHTDHGSEVLAHLGAMTGLPVAANCVSAVSNGDGSYQLVRHRWAGSLLEDAVLEASTALLTVAVDAGPAEPVAGAGSEADAGVAGVGFGVAAVGFGVAGAGSGVAGAGSEAAAVVHDYRPTLEEADLVVCARESAERSAGVSLATARVVVGGGRGVGGPDGFGPLEELAGLLGGALGVSRVVTSQGWRPHKQQVGQTGTRISPDLYLACGISGATQHMAGCLSAKHIVAVNTDPDAPIISHADYAVIGDLNQVIPALVTALRARSGPQ